MILQNPMAPGLGVGGLSQAVQGFSCEEMGICVGFCCSESVSPMSNCPDVFQLRALLEGDADDNVATHVDGCRTCLERLDELARQDAPTLDLGPVAVGRSPELDSMVAYLSRTVPLPADRREMGELPGPIHPVCPEIPGFEHLELVGQGGSGHVYRAWQPTCARWVALKILNPARGLGTTPRVLREARFLGRLNHPHIVRILDSGTHQGQPYLVMEWIAGGALDARLKQGPLSIQQTAQLGQQIASALESVHALGMVHRDIKPANVLLEEPKSNAGGVIAKLTDFGIARDEQAEERLTSTGMILGTPQYMSPEQTGLSPDAVVVGPASDIYGVGAVLFACLTGRAPHSGGGKLSTISRVARIEPPAPRTLRGDIPIDLDTIVIKCLRRNPAQRYRSAGELAEDLNRFLQGLPIAARPYTPAERLWNWLRRHPVAAVFLAMTAMLLLTLLGGGLYHLRSKEALIAQLSAQRDIAEEQKTQAEDAAQRAAASRDKAVDLFRLASQALLAGVSPQPIDRQRIIEEVRASQLAESDDLEKLTLDRAEFLAGVLLNLNFIERRDELVDLHEADSERILRLARQFPQSEKLRKTAALSLFGHHALQLGANRLEVARQILQVLASLGEHEPNEQIGTLLTYRNQAVAEERQGDLPRALATLDEACTIAQGFLERNVAEINRWLILLDLQHLRAQIATRLPTPEVTAFAPWQETLERFLATHSDISEQALLQRQRVVCSQLDLAMHSERVASARALLKETRPDATAAHTMYPQAANLIELRLARALCLSKVEQKVSLTPDEEQERQQAVEGARQFLHEHPGQPEMIRRLSKVLLFQSWHHMARRLPEEGLSTARQVLALLTPLGVSPAPFPEITQLVCDAHVVCSDALRESPQVAERRLHLASAFQVADANRRPGLALELVKLLLQQADLLEAERVGNWIPRDHPAWAEARSLIDAARNPAKLIDSPTGEAGQSHPARTDD